MGSRLSLSLMSDDLHNEMTLQLIFVGRVCECFPHLSLCTNSVMVVPLWSFQIAFLCFNYHS